MNERCRDPCPGACGINALCTVFNHISQCGCAEQYTGDPFTRCIPMPEKDGKYLTLTFIFQIAVE